MRPSEAVLTTSVLLLPFLVELFFGVDLEDFALLNTEPLTSEEVKASPPLCNLRKRKRKSVFVFFSESFSDSDSDSSESSLESSSDLSSDLSLSLSLSLLELLSSSFVFLSFFDFFLSLSEAGFAFFSEPSNHLQALSSFCPHH